MLALFCIACAGLGARTAQAAPYYVTVAGLGGEPDYEQRFTALAKDLDKLFKAAASDAHVYTLTGSDATKAHLTDTLGQIAREAKPEDEFTLILIGHGSYDGEEYKFNLPGPDISGEDLAILCDRIPAKRQLIVNTTSASGGSIGALQKAGTHRDRRDENRHGEKRHRVCALLGGRAARRLRRHGQERSHQRARSFRLCRSQDGGILRIAKATGDRACRVRRYRQEGSRSRGFAENGEGLLAANFVLLRLGAAQKAANDPAKRALLDKKEELERKIDMLKYQKAAMSAEDYKKQLSDALLELARVQGDLDK